MEAIEEKEQILASLEYNISIKQKEYEELDLKYRALLTKYDVLDNLDNLVAKKSEIFKELHDLEDKLVDTKTKIRYAEENMMRYDATKLVIGIVKNNGYSISVFTYFKDTYHWDKFANKYRDCKIYKDIEYSSYRLTINDENKIVDYETNVKVIEFIKYLDFVKLTNPKLAKEKSVTLKDIKEVLSVFANYDLNNASLEEIIYSLKAIKKNKKRKRRLK